MESAEINANQRRRRRRPQALAAAAAAVGVVALGAIGSTRGGDGAGQPTTLILVRHAEKAAGENPVLTAAGTARAAALVEVVEDAGVAAVYATEWCRTALTAEPLAAALGQPIRVQPNQVAGDQLAGCGLTRPAVPLDGSIAGPADLLAHVLAAHRGERVVIVGHSNTVPALVEAAGGSPLCPDYFALIDGACRIPDQPGHDEYHHLFVLEVPGRPAATRLVKARYGD